MKKPADDTGKIARSAGTVGAAVMCSRVLGLVREQAFAILFGAGFAYDAFVVAFRIPNLLRDLFGEGALSAAFVAVFSDYDVNKGEKATWELANNVLTFFGIALSVIVLLGIFFSGPLVRLLVEADFELVPGKVALTRKLTVIMFPFLLFVSLSSVVMGMLNTKGRFFVPAMSSSFFNLGSIIGGVGLAFIMPRFGQPAIAGMAVGTLIGGVLQLAGQLPALKGTGFTFRPLLHLREPGLRRLLRLMVPAIIGLAPLQINVLVNTYFASSLEQGSLSWLSYAFRLFFLPVGLFGVALSVATMPVISRYAALRNMVKLKETYASSLTMVFCLTIPASIGLVLLAEPIIRMIFQYGSFDPYTTQKTSEALRYYALGLFAYAAMKIMVPVFYALDDTRYPVIGSFITMVCNVLIITFTIGSLHHKALALSISGALIVNFLFLSLALYRKMAGYSLAYIGRGLAKVLLASSGMAVWLLVLLGLFGDMMRHGVVANILGVLAAIASGALLYGGLLYVLRLEELTLLTERVMARFFPSAG